MLIDTHCHLHDPEWFTSEQSELFLQEARENGVQKVICIGTNPQDSEVARDYANAHDDVYWTYGIHPEFCRSPREENVDIFFRGDAQNIERSEFASQPEMLVMPELSSFRESPEIKVTDVCRERLKERSADREEREPRKDGRSTGSLKANVSNLNSRLVAIGEIGLDYHYDGYDRTAQIRLFEQMLQLALDLKLPVSLHIREAFTDAFAVIDNFSGIYGVVHSFTGSKKDLRQALERGFYIGVNGLCTYTTNPLPPLEKMLLETDAPFLTPIPFRGTINKPGYVKTIATYLAEKLGVAEANIVEQTTQNARNIFQV